MIDVYFFLVIFLVVILIFNHYKKNNGIVWAAITVIAAAVKYLVGYNSISDLTHEPFILRLLLINGLIGFIPGISLILYIKSILRKNTKWDFLLFLLIIPPLLYAVNFIPYYQLSIPQKLLVFQNPDSLIIHDLTFWISWDMSNRIEIIYNTVLIFSTIIYLTIKLINKQNLSKKTAISLMQIYFIIIINFVQMVISIMLATNYTHFYHSGAGKLVSLLCLILPISLLLFPRYLYDNFNNLDLAFYLKLFDGITPKHDQTDEIQDKLKNDSRKILAYLHNEKPYLSPDFSKHDISLNLNIPLNIVTDSFSKVINVNFPQYRNQLRVEYAMERFRNSAHIKNTIAGIAAESGFKNRTTFYTAFKEVTNMNPVDWIKINCGYTIEGE